MGIVSLILQVIAAIPKILEGIRALMAFAHTVRKESQSKENQEIRNEVEHAQTPEEKQDALDHAGRRLR